MLRSKVFLITIVIILSNKICCTHERVTNENNVEFMVNLVRIKNNIHEDQYRNDASLNSTLKKLADSNVIEQFKFQDCWNRNGKKLNYIKVELPHQESNTKVLHSDIVIEIYEPNIQTNTVNIYLNKFILKYQNSSKKKKFLINKHVSKQEVNSENCMKIHSSKDICWMIFDADKFLKKWFEINKVYKNWLIKVIAIFKVETIAKNILNKNLKPHQQMPFMLLYLSASPNNNSSLYSKLTDENIETMQQHLSKLRQTRHTWENSNKHYNHKLKKDNNHHNYAPQRKRRINDEAGHWCKRKPLFINFSDFEWDWIIAPTTYKAFYCSGKCPSPLHSQMNATNHAVMQMKVHDLNPAVPRPCCVPTEMSSLSLFYYDEMGTVLKDYKNMIVEACGCR